MKYLLLLTDDPDAAPSEPDPADEIVDDYVEMTRLLTAAGVLVAGDALRPPDTATTVRVRDGARLLTDGPWAETTESLIGYYLIDVADLDAALHWAAMLPNQRHGAVDVRPVMDSPASYGAVARG